MVRARAESLTDPAVLAREYGFQPGLYRHTFISGEAFNGDIK